MNSERGATPVELALGLMLLVVPVAIIVLSIAPVFEHRNFARRAASEAARIMVLTTGDPVPRRWRRSWPRQGAWGSTRPGHGGVLRWIGLFGRPGDRRHRGCGRRGRGTFGFPADRHHHRPLGSFRAGRPLQKPPVNSERGSAPIWFLGLSLCVLMVGALSAELWRAIGERQELVAMADAAAIAAAGAIDLEHYRATGETVDRSRPGRGSCAAGHRGQQWRRRLIDGHLPSRSPMMDRR